MTYWDLNHLLAINVASPQKRDALRKAGANGETFVAWILYAYTPAGAGLHDSSGVSNAIARTLESPRGGPGWPANALAKLSPYKLKAMLEKDLEGKAVDDDIYLAAFGSLEDQAKEELRQRLFGE
jgi:galactokinase/mevalonate kinase-like predicted kinase